MSTTTSSSSSRFLKTQQLDPQTDIAFRCPLGPQLSSMISSSVDNDDSNNNNNNNNSNNNNIQPLLYRMYIACHILKFRIETRFTALVFLHRYNIATSSNNSNKQQQQKKTKKNLEWVAAACLFLASKAEEEPRRLRDVINLAQMLLSTTTTTTTTTTTDNSNNNNKTSPDTTMTNTTNTTSTTINNCIQIQQTPPNLNQKYWDCKKHIVETEQDVLRWLGYDTSVSHPHRLVLLLLENIDCCPHQSQIQKTLLVQKIAFRRLNDALFYQFALQHPILELSIAAIELAIEELEMTTTTTTTTMIVAEQNGGSSNNNEENINYFAAASDESKKIKSILNCHYKRYNLSQSKVMKAKTDLEDATRILKQQQKTTTTFFFERR